MMCRVSINCVLFILEVLNIKIKFARASVKKKNIVSTPWQNEETCF